MRTIDLDVFRACRRACLAVVRHTLDPEAPRIDDAQISLLLDAAELCETTLRFGRRSSTLHPRLCTICVEVCERCADMCEAYPGDAVMRTCMERCRRCADVCRRLGSDASPGDASPATPDASGMGGSPFDRPKNGQPADDEEGRPRRARA